MNKVLLGLLCMVMITPVKLGKDYSIYYDANGGEGAPVETIKKKGDTYTLPTTIPHRTGYTFKGWGITKAQKTPTYQPKDTYKDDRDLTLYALWDPYHYPITYVLNGGTNNKANPATYTVKKAVTLKDAEKQGYRFKGWYKDQAMRRHIKKITKGTTGNLTLRAKWKLNKYTINYTYAYTNPDNPKTYTINDPTFRLDIPTRKGYIFQGWYHDKEFKKRVWQITKGHTGNLRFYAKWAKLSLSEKSLTMKVGDTQPLYIVNGIFAQWSSSNKKVVEVSTGGKVTALQAGSATIKAKACNKTFRCKIKVKEK